MSSTVPGAGTQDRQIKKPNRIVKILVVLAAIWGIICILSSFSTGGARNTVAGILIGLGFLIPSGWWLYCNRVDQKNQQQYEETIQQNAALAPLLGEEDVLIRQGMGMVSPPSRKSRRWGVVWSAAVAALIAGGLTAPSAEPNGAPTPTATTTAASTSETTTSKPSTTAPTTTRNTEAEASSSRVAASSAAAASSSSAAAASRSAEEEQARLEEQARMEREQAEIARSAEQVQQEEQNTQMQGFVAPVPEPELAQSQSVYYANCKAVWSAIGRPISRGEPGYASHLDRNGDGVGCEQNPF